MKLARRTSARRRSGASPRARSLRTSVEGRARGARRGEVVLLGIGSNLGDRAANLARVIEILESNGAIRVLARSRLRETEPVGGPPQGEYLNGAVLAGTDLGPRELLAALKRAEAAVGRRTGGPRWGPREVDVDLLLYGDRVIEETDLVVPHPRMAERRFVLEPAAEIAPRMRHPVLRRTIASLLEKLP